jgi:hypothetical protein
MITVEPVDLEEETAPPPPPPPSRPRPAMHDPFAQAAPVHGLQKPAPEPEIAEEPEGGSGVSTAVTRRYRRSSSISRSRCGPRPKRPLMSFQKWRPTRPSFLN